MFTCSILENHVAAVEMFCQVGPFITTDSITSKLCSVRLNRLHKGGEKAVHEEFHNCGQEDDGATRMGIEELVETFEFHRTYFSSRLLLEARVIER